MTDDPRYPVGPFTPKGEALTPRERRAHIDRIAAHPDRMRSLVQDLDDGQLDTPYRDGGWTVRQVVHHVADSHMNSYVRFKLGMTEDTPTIRTYDQDRWAASGEAVNAPVSLSLDLLDALHRRWVVFLETFTPADFARPVYHPEMERNISLDTLLELYGWHTAHHEGHIKALRRRMGW